MCLPVVDSPLTDQLRQAYVPVFGGGYAHGSGELVFIKVSVHGQVRPCAGNPIDMRGGVRSHSDAEFWYSQDISPQEGGIAAGLAEIVAKNGTEELRHGANKVIFEMHSVVWPRLIKTVITTR
jgi:hypothetical protein